VFFVSVIGVWYAIQRRKTRLLQTHGQGREDYEFAVLPSDGDDSVPQRRAGELYDAFAGEEQYLRKEVESDYQLQSKPRRSGGDIEDGEMSGFLADSDEEQDVDIKEKVTKHLLADKR
jgi:hypothetical protein